MNAMNQLAATPASSASSAAAQLAHASRDVEPDHSKLLDLMSGDPDQIDAFFDRMFAD